MPSTSVTGRTRRPWLRWGLPIVVVVLLAAVATGLASRDLDLWSEPRMAPIDEPAPAPISQGSPDVVRFSRDAAKHPDYIAVRSLLQNHFDSINLGYYERWQTTVVEQREQESPEREWMKNYASTSDTAIRVHRIEQGPDDSLRVLMTFTSHQSPENAPDGQSNCLRWRVVYPLVSESGQLLLGTSQYSGSSLRESC